MASITTRAGKGSALTNAELDANFTNLNTELATKQATLVSGTSIKTINGSTLLGSGDLLLSVGVTTSDAAPASPTDNQLWWDSVNGALKIYFNDGTSSQWVDASQISVGSSGGTTPYSGEYVLSGTTTNATETELFVGGVANTRIALTDGKVISYVVQIVGRRTDGTTMESAVFELRSAARRSGGTVTDIGGVLETIVYRADVNFAVDSRVDGTNLTLGIYVTGAAGKSISWRAVVQTIEV